MTLVSQITAVEDVKHLVALGVVRRPVVDEKPPGAPDDANFLF
jgi:hypothetical protein